MESSDIKKLKFDLYVQNLRYVYGENAIGSYELRIEKELSAIQRLIKDWKYPPNTIRHSTVYHNRRRKALIERIGRKFAVIDEMHRLIMEAKDEG